VNNNNNNKGRGETNKGKGRGREEGEPTTTNIDNYATTLHTINPKFVLQQFVPDVHALY